MTKLEHLILYSVPFKLFYKITKRIYLPGFEGLSLYVILRFFFKELNNIRLNERGAAVTYNFLMAIPPTLLFLFSLVPYVPLKGVEQSLQAVIKLLSPNNSAYQSMNKFLMDFLHHEHKDILSFGILMTLYFSSNGMMGLMRGFDRNLPVLKKRSAFKRRWTALKLTLIFLTATILTLLALLMQTKLLNHFLLSIFGNIWAIKIFSLIILIPIVFSTISFIYTEGPSLTHEFKFVSAGSVFATVFCFLATALFFYLVNHVLQYNKVYGSIGTLIAFMVWLWLVTQIILLGYELNLGILIGKITEHEHELKAEQHDHA